MGSLASFCFRFALSRAVFSRSIFWREVCACIRFSCLRSACSIRGSWLTGCAAGFSASGFSTGFLCWFLPTTDISRLVVAEIKAPVILSGNFYWYDNNWHYIRKLYHLKTATTLNRLSDLQRSALHRLQETDFSVSDAVMGRCVSTAVSLTWTEEQIAEKGTKMAAAIKEVLSKQAVGSI